MHNHIWCSEVNKRWRVVGHGEARVELTTCANLLDVICKSFRCHEMQSSPVFAFYAAGGQNETNEIMVIALLLFMNLSTRVKSYDLLTIYHERCLAMMSSKSFVKYDGDGYMYTIRGKIQPKASSRKGAREAAAGSKLVAAA